jgi:virulence-associated protein VapD
MFAVAFDLDVAAANRHHPGRNQGAYSEIRRILTQHGFRRIQGSTYAADHEDQAKLYLALSALQRLEWIGHCLHNIRVFRMEAGADFTAIMRHAS